MKKNNLTLIVTILGINILGIYALLTSLTDLPMDKFAITVSFWAFGYTLYISDKNIFFALAFLLMGILNLISKTILLYDMSTIVIYLSGIVILSSTINKKNN